MRPPKRPPPPSPESPDSLDSDAGQSPARLSRRIRKERKSRNESSLSVLTHKFIKMLEDSRDGTVDLNDAVSSLDVQKRRIYDITNVLEGIGYIQKFKKNKIKLMDQNSDSRLDSELEELAKKQKELDEQEADLDRKTEQKGREIETLVKDPSLLAFAHITREDLEGLMVSNQSFFPCFVVEASVDTVMDMFQPKGSAPGGIEPGHDFQVVIQSKTPVNLFYAHNGEN